MDYTDDACMNQFTPGQRTRATALMTSFRPQMMNGRGAFVGTPPVAFPETYTGQTRTRVVRIVNLSAAPITVTGATSSSAAFSVEGATGAIIPEAGALDLVLSFAPTAAGPASGTITFATDDPDTPTVTLAVSGAAVLPASAALAPQAFLAEVAPGGSVTRTLTLSNAGPAALAYAVNAVTRTSAPMLPLVDGGRDGGGPDAFGYRWNDSREAGGPIYDWVDISTTGTVVSLPSTNSATAVTLPFSFPFYGTPRTTTQVSSNGLLVFTGTATSPFQASIPNGAAPNDYIAPFWRNLNPTLGGEVRTQDMGDGRFVISWIDVPPSTGSGTYTFQAILYANGRIRFQYQFMTGPVNAGAIGIENATGTVGLQVAYNAPDFVVDGLAVDVFTLPAWLSVAPSAGTVPVGQTQDVTLSMNAADLIAGSYQALVDVTTNDPSLPQPTRLHAVFSVGGVLAPPALSAPRYGADAEPTSAALSWLPAPGATSFEWQVSATSDFATVLETGSTAGAAATPTLATGTTYWWRVRSADGVLPSAWSVPFTFTTAGIVSDEPGAPVVRSALGQPFPNPTQGAVTVPFALAEAEASVWLRVVDVTGRTVATLAESRAFGAGEHRLSVDASRLAPGVYVVQLRTSTGTESARLTVLR